MARTPRVGSEGRRCVVLFLPVCLALTAGVVVSARPGFANDIYLDASSKPILAAYFGMHIHEAVANGTWPAIPFGAWRLSDTGVAWPDLEPQRGRWNFKRLDEYVATARAHDVELLLPLAQSPRWASARPDEPSNYHQPGWAAEPRHIEDWRAYVRHVARRYRGRMRYYEIWNEPNTKGLYSGSIESLVELTRTAREELKAVDPANVVVSPSFVDEGGLKKLDEFLARGGAKYVDVIGFHFYRISEKPEDMLSLISRVRRIMQRHGVGAKPLWDTETGWLIANSRGTIDPTRVGFPRHTPVLSAERASAYVARALILSWAAGVNRVYWYAWDNKAMGLSEEEGKTLKPAAYAYRRLYRWLDGATLNFCRGSGRGIWTCQLNRRDGDRDWLVWTTTEASRWVPPVQWHAAEWEALDGESAKIARDSASLAIGPTPVLVRTSIVRRTSLP